jgi:hypothetical protein
MPIVFLYAALVLSSLETRAAGPTTSTFTFALRLSMAVDAQGAPVATPEWTDAQLASAKSLYAPFGVAFRKVEGASLEAKLGRVETAADRDAFADRTRQHVIDVFVVESLRDVDDPSRMRRGVHWHRRSASGAPHYVIIVGTAPSTVLAHELGHYFGNPHSPVPDDVMSYERTGAPVFFDDAQGKRIAERAREYVRSGELVPVAR